MLIALPALVLAAMGLVALRQDRLVVRQQAVEEARRLAQSAAQLLTGAPLEAVAPQLPGQEQPPDVPTPSRPEDDPVFAYANRPPGWIVCLVNAQGELLAPVPENISPPASTHPEAQALFQAAVLAAASGQLEAARERLVRLRREFPRAQSETGVPLSLYAGLHLLKLPRAANESPQDRLALLQATCSEAVLQCPVLAPAILDSIEMGGADAVAAVAIWRRVWIAQQRSRLLHAAWSRTPPSEKEGKSPRWMHDAQQEPELWAAAPSGSNVWVMALPEANLATTVEAALIGLGVPKHLVIEPRIAGRALSSESAFEELASAAVAPQPLRPAVEVRVRLKDEKLLYAQQRARARWFGALLSIATFTMLAGLWMGGRAFRRQRELAEMKSNFVSSVSHELRAPIASVRLMAEELDDLAGADAKKTRSYHGFIVQECRRLSALIENVLDFSRQEQGRKEYHFEPTDLRSLVETTAKLMRVYAADKQIEIRTELPKEPVEMEADGRALQQVLVNLIDNAIKHSTAGSSVTVGLDCTSEAGGEGSEPTQASWRERLRRFVARQKGSPAGQSRVRLWVEDEGEGIPPEEQERIFERFYRPGSELRRESQGVGLGLAIVKYVTEAHGGRVHVRSAVGQGSRFTVELPLHSAAQKEV
jgi:signal transduction histidine kinase